MIQVACSIVCMLSLCAQQPSETQIDLVVVAKEAWREELTPFVEFKRARAGISSCALLTIESVESTGTAPAPADSAEALKRALFQLWKEGKCDAVLLVGDSSVLPVRYMMLDRNTEPAFDTAFYASDLYFGDLARGDGTFDDWNASRSDHHAQYFGEVHGEHHKSGPINFDGVSYTPEIAVGRWPARNVEEAVAIAAKSMRTETAWAAHAPAAQTGNAQTKSAPAKSALPARHPALFVAAGGWIDNRKQIEALARDENAPWQPRLFAWFAPENAADEPTVRAALATKPRLVFHTGHGQPWGWEQCLNRETLASNAGAEELPVIFSIGCSTAEIAPQPPYTAYVDVIGVRHKGTNAGEIFTTPPPPPAVIQPADLDATSISEDSLRWKDCGAVAAIGCVTGSQPCAHTLLDGFVQAARASPGNSIGQWWMDALRHYHHAEHLDSIKPSESWYPASIYFQGMKFVLLGDPTLRPLENAP